MRYITAKHAKNAKHSSNYLCDLCALCGEIFYVTPAGYLKLMLNAGRRRKIAARQMDGSIRCGFCPFSFCGGRTGAFRRRDRYAEKWEKIFGNYLKFDVLVTFMKRLTLMVSGNVQKAGCKQD